MWAFLIFKACVRIESCEQLQGVGVLGIFKDFGAATALHDLPGKHDRDIVRSFVHKQQVVGDQKHRCTGFAAKIPDQTDNLLLNNGIQRCGRFVCNQQRGFANQRHGDQHPLAHAARQLMRKGAEPFTPARNLNAVKHGQRGGARPDATNGPVGLKGLGELIADCHHRVERKRRILEQYGHPAAAQFLKLLCRGS